MSGYALTIVVPLGYQAALDRARDAPAEQGFGVLKYLGFLAAGRAVQQGRKRGYRRSETAR